MRYVPRGDNDRPIVGGFFAGEVGGGSGVTVRVIDMVNNAVLASTTGAAVQQGATAFWIYDLADVTGTIGGATLEDVPFAMLAVEMTGTLSGVVIVEHVEINGVDRENWLHALYQGAIWCANFKGAPGQVLGVNGTPTNPVDNDTDALALANALGVNVYRIVSDAPSATVSAFVIDLDHSEWVFQGDSHQQSGIAFDNTAKPELDNCVIRDCQISGSLSDADENTKVLFERCRVENAISLHGTGIVFDQCLVENATIAINGTAKLGSRVLLRRCELANQATANNGLDAAGFPFSFFILEDCHGSQYVQGPGLLIETIGGSGFLQSTRASVTEDFEESIAALDKDWVWVTKSDDLDWLAVTYKDTRLGEWLPVLNGVSTTVLRVSQMEAQIGIAVTRIARLALGARLDFQNAAGTVIEQRSIVSITLVEKDVGFGNFVWQITVNEPLSVTPALGDSVMLYQPNEEWPFENVLVDNHTYSGNVLQSARFTKFQDAAAAAAATPGAGSHSGTVKEITITHSESSPGKTDQFRGVKQ